MRLPPPVAATPRTVPAPGLGQLRFRLRPPPTAAGLLRRPPLTPKPAGDQADETESVSAARSSRLTPMPALQTRLRWRPHPSLPHAVAGRDPDCGSATANSMRRIWRICGQANQTFWDGLSGRALTADQTGFGEPGAGVDSPGGTISRPGSHHCRRTRPPREGPYTRPGRRTQVRERWPGSEHRTCVGLRQLPTNCGRLRLSASPDSP